MTEIEARSRLIRGMAYTLGPALLFWGVVGAVVMWAVGR